MFSPILLVRSYSRLLCHSDLNCFSKSRDFLKISRLLFQQVPKSFSTDGKENDQLPTVYKYFVNSKLPSIMSSDPAMKVNTAKAAIKLEWMKLSDDEKKKIKDQYNATYNIQEESIEELPPKSAYQAFCKEHRPLIQKNVKVTIPIGSMSKLLSDKYWALSDAEREKYSVYQPEVKPKEKAPPRNTWEAFCRAQRPLLLAEAADTSIGAISKSLSEKYKALSDEEKEKYMVHKDEQKVIKELLPPKNAFQAYCREHRPLVKASLSETQKGKGAAGEMLKILSANWKALSEDEKKKYEIVKDPKPPKRVSAYSAFLAVEWKKMKSQDATVTLAQVSKKASEDWKKLPHFEKELYERQHEEKLLAAGVPPKESAAPRPPPKTAYQAFVREQWAVLAAEPRATNVGNINLLLSQKWKALPEDQKLNYKQVIAANTSAKDEVPEPTRAKEEKKEQATKPPASAPASAPAPASSPAALPAKKPTKVTRKAYVPKGGVV